jgi:hypothetical protein
MSDGGKGSKPRPISVAQEEYDKRWDAIFQRDILKDNLAAASQLENERLELYRKSDSEIEKLFRYNEETQEVKKNV